MADNSNVVAYMNKRNILIASFIVLNIIVCYFLYAKSQQLSSSLQRSGLSKKSSIRDISLNSECLRCKIESLNSMLAKLKFDKKEFFDCNKIVVSYSYDTDKTALLNLITKSEMIVTGEDFLAKISNESKAKYPKYKVSNTLQTKRIEQLDSLDALIWHIPRIADNAPQAIYRLSVVCQYSKLLEFLDVLSKSQPWVTIVLLDIEHNKKYVAEDGGGSISVTFVFLFDAYLKNNTKE